MDEVKDMINTYGSPTSTLHEVSTREEVIELLNHAQKNRIVASTKCNDQSSRSHSVF